MSRGHALKDECKNPNCQHERDSHHKDDEGVWNCLAMRCECRRFHDKAPIPMKTRPGAKDDEWGTNKPHSDTTCDCAECHEWKLRKQRTWTPYGYGTP